MLAAGIKGKQKMHLLSCVSRWKSAVGEKQSEDKFGSVNRQALTGVFFLLQALLCHQ